MLAHLFRDAKGYHWSGYLACGDPFDGAGFRASQTLAPRPFDAIVDAGSDFIITHDGLLYLTSPGRWQCSVWTPEKLVAAARYGMFGMRLLQER